MHIFYIAQIKNLTAFTNQKKIWTCGCFIFWATKLYHNYYLTPHPQRKRGRKYDEKGLKGCDKDRGIAHQSTVRMNEFTRIASSVRDEAMSLISLHQGKNRTSRR